MAQEEAKRLKHQSVSSEHVLLALVVEQNGIAGKVLREMDLNETEIYEEIEHLIGYGGIIVSIKNELEIPVKLIGVGEKIDDLQPFHARDFVNALFETEERK